MTPWSDPPSNAARTLVQAKEAAILRAAYQRTGAVAVILAVITAATSGQRGWQLAALVAVLMIVTAVNLTLNRVARRNLGPGDRVELARTVFNAAFCIFFSHLAHWPLSSFGWLVYCAFVSQLHERWAVVRFALVGGAIGAAAITDGVNPSNVALFGGIAVLVFFMGRAHVKSLREVILRSVESRLELEKAHGDLAQSATLVREEMRLRESMELELRRSQKLESVGRLAAGVAHEINTPVQFVGDSLEFLREAAAAQFALRTKYRASIDSGLSAAEVKAQCNAADEEADVAYLEANVAPAFERSRDGLQRVAAIVRAMKVFAHPDQCDLTAADLNRAIESTLTIARNEYKYIADLQTDFGDLARVTCAVGEINQAVLNIVINAAHAMGDRYKGTDKKGVLKVKTRQEGNTAVISIGDDGGGIPRDIRERVFDPFFTTKEVGRGTGQGLAIARSVVVGRHHGSLTFDVDEALGTTTFFIRLPVATLPRVAAIS